VSREEQAVEPIQVDVEARQIVRWLLKEERVKAFDLLLNVTRSFERAELTAGEERQMDDAGQELNEINEVGELEVMPRKEPSRWTLRIRVVDDIGPRMPDDEPVPAEDEEIDVETFNEEFIVADRGFTEVSAETQDRAASAELARLIEAIVTDRHKPAG
jgi:hypothetical protein